MRFLTFVLYFYYSYANRQRGNCLNLRNAADFKISEQQEWGKAGYAIIQLDFAKYKNSLVRRAGIINDRTFLEVQIQTQSKKGTIPVWPGKPEYPIEEIISLGNNQFQIDLVDDASKALSDSGVMEFKLRLKHSPNLNKNVWDVRYSLISVLLCDGGYTDTLNKEKTTPIPPGCKKVSTQSMSSLTLPTPGMAKFTAVFKSGEDEAKIGCGAYMLVGFDARANVKEFNWPIKRATKVNKQMDSCSNNQNDCNGFFYRLDFDNEVSNFTSSKSSEIELLMTYQGTESHVPIGILQYNCNTDSYCEGDELIIVDNSYKQPQQIDYHAPQKEQEGFVVVQKDQVGFKVTTVQQNNQQKQSKPTSTPTSTAATQTRPPRTKPPVTIKSTTTKSTITTTTQLEKNLNEFEELEYLEGNFAFNDAWSFDLLFDMMGALQDSKSFGATSMSNGLAPADLTNYGCTCLSLNPGQKNLGLPLDDTDRTCNKWKQCHKCVRDEHGGSCDSKYKTNLQGDCVDQIGSCQRQMCECDRSFTISLGQVQPKEDHYAPKLDTDLYCRKAFPNGNGSCCQSPSGLFTWYNSNQHDCCSSGNIAEIGSC